MEIINPIEKIGQEVNINLHCSASNVDWIHAGRLLEQANAGDKQARKELDKLDNSNMVEWEEDEPEQ